MAEIPKDVKKLLFGMGIKWHAMASFIMNSVALVCLISLVCSLSCRQGRVWKIGV